LQSWYYAVERFFLLEKKSHEKCRALLSPRTVSHRNLSTRTSMFTLVKQTFLAKKTLLKVWWSPS
jgi:hypothetical protein